METVPKDAWTEIMEHFQQYQTVFLATADGACPRVRPVTLARLDGRFWVLTGTQDAKVSQIRGNPNFEFCLPFGDHDGNGYVRAAGMIAVVHDSSIRQQIARQCDYFGKYWTSPCDPTFTLLELGFLEVEYLRPGGLNAKRYRL